MHKPLHNFAKVGWDYEGGCATEFTGEKGSLCTSFHVPLKTMKSTPKKNGFF